MTFSREEVRAALQGRTYEPVKVSRCGYCQAEVTPDQAPSHWMRGWVSRCLLRWEIR